ncbi:MAG: thiamine phosphate synthase [Bacteroidia bacterium]|nr:thiamine phosphate synthase [Bacteroidia bacterium]MDW8158889.1 thiamine phosphate synthase [Bacteroidia bacterium]
MWAKKFQLHLISDTTIQNKFTHLELAQFAFAAGATVFQFREKNLRSSHIRELEQIIALSRNYPTKVIINDYLELALELGANGVHLGVEDIPLSQAISRAREKDNFIIGATCHTLEELQDLNNFYKHQIHYIGVGPIFGSTSKKIKYPPLGLEGLAQFCKQSHFPVIAIGNIQPFNIPSLIAAGASGIAVIKAFCGQTSPLAAAHALQKQLNQAI